MRPRLLLVALVGCTAPTAPPHGPGCALVADVDGIALRSYYAACPAPPFASVFDYHGQRFRVEWS